MLPTTLVAFLLLDNAIFPLSLPTRRIIAIAFSLTIATAICIQISTAKAWFKLLMLSAPAIYLILPGRTLVVLYFVFLIGLLPLFGDPKLKFAGPLSKALFSVVILGKLAVLIPQIRVIENLVSQGFTFASNQRWDAQIEISASAMGLECWLVGILLLAFSWNHLTNSIRFLAASILLASPALLIWIVPFHYDHHPLEICKWVGWFWCVQSLVISTCISFGAMISSTPESARQSLAGNTSPTGKRMALVAVIASVFIGLTLTKADTYLNTPTRKIVVHNRGGLDWERPTYENTFGGMFGQLPIYARANGYELDIIDRDQIIPSDLENQQVLVLINSGTPWGKSKEVILDFVREGGSLIVLGDHTDVFGLMKCFNDLLGDAGIRFKFDSAYNARDNWRGCLVTTDNAMECRWEQINPGLAVGASFDLSGYATAIVSGRYGHSDTGMRGNVMGSFLGNYKFDDEELIGDLPLVAEVNVGQGRILAFGDTSTFQGAIASKMENVVIPIFEYVCRRPGYLERNLAKLFAGILSATLVLMLFGSSVPIHLASQTSLFLTLLIGTGWGLFVQNKDLVIDNSTVLIAQHSFNNTGHYDVNVNPIGPLYSAIHRCGFRQHEPATWNREEIMSSRAVCFIAPQKHFTESQIAQLNEYELQGGVLIVAVGRDDFKPSESLLNAHMLTLANRPLGRVNFSTKQTKKNRSYPQLVDAWPIESTNGLDLEDRSDIDVLLAFGGETLVVFCKKGQGGMLLISDSRFFSSTNIERFPSFKWEGNVQFVKQLFTKYLKADPDSIDDVFPSHEKPK